MGMKRMFTLAALMTVGMIGGAVAQDSALVSGTVQEVDPGARTVVLDNGRSYQMDENAPVGSLERGAMVSLACGAPGVDCMIVASATPNDIGRESDEQPSAGATDDAQPQTPGTD